MLQRDTSISVERYDVQEVVYSTERVTVYRGIDQHTGLMVALKWVPAFSENRARAVREAAILRRVDHPHVVRILDVLEGHDGSVTLVFPWYTQTLAECLREESLDLCMALVIAEQLCDAVSHLHCAGIIHRDLKPDNMFVTILPSGRPHVVVSDFNAALPRYGTRITAPNHIVGTLSYMSPESLMGADLDTSSDVYSLGTIAYELLVGTPAFEGTLAELVVAKLRRPPPIPSRRVAQKLGRFSREIDSIVLRAMARNPNQRYASAAKFGMDIRELARRAALYRNRVRRHAPQSVVAPLDGWLKSVTRLLSLRE